MMDAAHTLLKKTALLFTLSLFVTAGGLEAQTGTIAATPNQVTWSFTSGSGVFPASQLLSLTTTTDATTYTASTTTSNNWLLVNLGIPGGAIADGLSLGPSANINSLATGVYQATVALTDPLGGTGSVTVTLTVNGGTTNGPTLTLNPASLTYNAVVNGASPAAQIISVTALSSTGFSTTASTANSLNWLSAIQSSTFTPATVTVSVNSTILGVGTYTGTVALIANGITQTVSVTLNVTTTGTGGGNVTADKSSLPFTGQAGGANPAAQTLTISSTSTPVPVTVTASTSSGGNWLSVSPTSGNTPLTLSATASLAGLVAGTYNGTITVTPTGGNPLPIQVSLTVTAAPTVSVSTTALTFTYRAGDTLPAAQTVAVSGGGALTFAATASSTGNWLIVAPATGATPATVSVSVNPASLNANTYTGTVTVAGTGTATGTTAIAVTLTVSAPLPTVSKVTNAGSFATATAIAPGEIITLFASDAQHPIGPTAAVGLTLDSTGKVATTIGGVQVLAAGFACPMIFANATQVNAVVPYELAGFVFSGADVLVRFLGQTSNAIHVNVATTAPGLFTQNVSGTGPGAILNGNGSVNSPATPAPRGDIVSVFLTGEGQTTPTGVTGKVTTVAATGPLTPTPLLPISILIGPPGAEQAAGFTFAGEAPGFVSGGMQLNVRIPTTVNAGDQPIVVSIGPNSSQSGVTVSIAGTPATNQANCVTYPAGFVPYVSVNYLSGPNSAGDRLLVGSMSLTSGGNSQFPGSFAEFQGLPLPAATNQQFCGTVTLATGFNVVAYVPTAAERSGAFPAFSGLLVDPLGDNTPFPGGIIPTSRFPFMAWRIAAVQ